MGIPTINNFLCCLSLETGGFVLGWLTVMFSVLSGVLLAIVLIVAIIAMNREDYDTDELMLANIILGVIAGIYVIYMCVLLFASVQLIRGTKNRNHNQLKLYLLLMCIGLVMSFLQIFTIGISGIFIAIAMALIDLYLCLCIYSLYMKFKNERMNPVNMQNQYQFQPQMPNQIHVQYPPQFQTQIPNQGNVQYPANVQIQNTVPVPMAPKY